MSGTKVLIGVTASHPCLQRMLYIRHASNQLDPLVECVEGKAIHEILQPYRGEREQTVTCNEPILNHA